MTVVLTVSDTITGAEIADSLAGGSTGLDLLQVTNGSYSPVIDQGANTGAKALFVRHDAVDDPVTDLGMYVSTFTGTYGGANSAAADFSTLVAYGLANTGATKDNSDGNGRGLWIDMDWDVAVINQFDIATRDGLQVRVFGADYGGGLDGASLAQKFSMYQDAMSYWNGATEIAATAPVTGQLGKSDDTALGNRAHILARFYLHTGALEGGILQANLQFPYSFTS